MSLPPKKNPLEAFELLQKYNEFHKPLLNAHLPKAKVLRYIALVYDKQSPLHDAYPDLNRKKIIAADLAGFIKEDNGQYNPKVEELFRCDIPDCPDINPMIIRYLLLSKSALFQRFCILSEAYSNISAKFLTGNGKIDEFTKLGREIDDCESELLAHDNNLHEDFTQYYFESRLELRPEDIAERLKKGEQPIVLQEGVH